MSSPYSPYYTVPAVARYAQPAVDAPPKATGDYLHNYFQNPTIYTSSDRGMPVPGWGASVNAAGPARVGVGATPIISTLVKSPAQLSPALQAKIAAIATRPQSSASTSLSTAASSIPWWAWPTLAALGMVGLGYYGTKKGWF